MADFDIFMDVAGWQSVEQIRKDGKEYLESGPKGGGFIAEKSRLCVGLVGAGGWVLRFRGESGKVEIYQ